MMNRVVLPFVAAAATIAYRIAKFNDPSNGTVVALGAGPTEPLIGVFGAIAHDSGDVADVIVSGPAELELGGTVTTGQPLSSDSVGRAVALANPGTGVTNRAIAWALQPGVSGDRIKVMVAPALLRTP